MSTSFSGELGTEERAFCWQSALFAGKRKPDISFPTNSLPIACRFVFDKITNLAIRIPIVGILLCGGDKRSQHRDIARALELAKEV